MFFCRFVLQLNPKIASSTLYGFSFHLVFLLLWSANVCKECVLWLKCEITAFSRCVRWPYASSVMGKILVKMPNLCEIRVFHKEYCARYLILVKTSEISK